MRASTPDVFDERGQKLNPMQYGQLIYSGQKVNAIVTCRAYNNKSRGIKCQLEGVQVVASANAARLNLGGGGFNAAAAFGGGGGAPAAQQPVNYGQPAQQPAGYGQPAQQPAGYGQPAQQPAGYGQPVQQPAGYGHAPQQAHGYLPQ
jgi:hypothetical protein